MDPLERLKKNFQKVPTYENWESLFRFLLRNNMGGTWIRSECFSVHFLVNGNIPCNPKSSGKRTPLEPKDLLHCENFCGFCLDYFLKTIGLTIEG